MLKRTTKPLRRTVLIEDGLAKSSKKQHLENTEKWHLCKGGSFSYGESPRTTPLEGTSLHRWNNSVERPWGILSLFTTCLQVQSPCHSLTHVDYTPNSTLRREEPKGTLKRTNPQEEELGCGQKKCMEKTQKEALRIKGALWNAKWSKTTM